MKPYGSTKCQGFIEKTKFQLTVSQNSLFRYEHGKVSHPTVFDGIIELTLSLLAVNFEDC